MVTNNNSFTFIRPDLVQMNKLTQNQCSYLSFKLLHLISDIIFDKIAKEFDYDHKQDPRYVNIIRFVPYIGSEQISNPYTGTLSIMLYGLVLYLFIDTMISTITLQQITATEVTRINENTEQSIENIVIGLGVQMINLNQMLDIFSVRAFITDQTNNSVSIPVVPCTRQMWAELDQVRFNSLNLQSGMCVPRQYAQIYSFSGISDAKGIYLMLSLCDNATSSVVCKTPAQISAFFASQRFMACSLYILNAGINPNDPNPIEYTINQKVLWLVFTQLQQIVVQSFLGKFEIRTDTSLLPWTTTQKITGYQVSQTIIATLMSLTPTSIFAQIFVFGSPNLKIIDRSYGKITEILGYVGGLFGLLVSFFAVFVSSYNRLRYQLIVSAAAFMAKNAGLSRVENFSFFKYLKFSFYCWCKTLCCCQLQWEDCQAIEIATSEASQQIQMGLILDRISHLDRAVSTLINGNLQLLLHLSDTHSIQQVQKRRSILSYYDKFTHEGLYTTMQIIEQEVNITTTTTEGSLFFNGLVEPTSFFELKQNPQQPQQHKQNSIKKMLEFVKKYSQKYSISPNTFKMTEQEEQVQKELAEQFYACDEQTRDKYISKIPLGILYRFAIMRQKIQKQGQKNTGKGKDISRSLKMENIHESYSQLEYKQNEEGTKKRKN